MSLGKKNRAPPCCCWVVEDKIFVCIFLSRFHEAWDLCKAAGSKADWTELGKACMVHMEVELAIQVYRMSGNVAMVLSLQSIQVHNTHSNVNIP